MTVGFFFSHGSGEQAVPEDFSQEESFFQLKFLSSFFFFLSCLFKIHNPHHRCDLILHVDIFLSETGVILY